QGSFTMGLAFSPDGQMLASGGGGDDIIRVWSVPEWRPIASLKGHRNGVWGLTFAPDGQTLISASRDDTVKFWRVPPALEQDSLLPAESLAGFTPQGSAVSLARN